MAIQGAVRVVVFLCAASIAVAAFNPLIREVTSSNAAEEYFPGISKIKYEGPKSENPLAFRYYDADKEIMGKKMRDWLRFSVAFGQAFRCNGRDAFGDPTRRWAFDDGTNSMDNAKRRMGANFEFLNKLGVDFWTFYDRDIAPEGKSLDESNKNLDEMCSCVKKLQDEMNVRPLWAGADLQRSARYMAGAATNPDVHVFAYAGAQVKKAMEMACKLGAEGFVMSAEREGYQTLLNTDMEKETKHLGTFFRAAADYKRNVGFKGNLMIEPKAREPFKHQYVWDAATTIGCLAHGDLLRDYKLNIECNHAIRAGHTCHHEVELARIAGVLGSIDANNGDALVGWDTDEFLTNVEDTTLVMAQVIKNGGISPGGFNIDARLRRESVDMEDLFIGHIVGMDALARGLENAARMIEDGCLQKLIDKRYESFNSDIGKRIDQGKIDFETLEKCAFEHGEPKLQSGKQELAEMVLHAYTASGHNER